MKKVVIEELHISSFGQYQNKIIRLNEHLNLIEGENEAGKSTILAFVEGVFYGFVKATAKRKILTFEFERYKPWFSQTYRGSIQIYADNTRFTIFRDFDTMEYSIHFSETGEDSSDFLKGYQASNFGFPGEYFLGVNRNVFNSLFNIKQNQINDIEDINGLKDLILNVGYSHDAFLSYSRTIEILQKRKDSLGTMRAFSKPLGRLYIQKEELEKKARELQTKDTSYHGLLKDYTAHDALKYEVVNQKIEIENDIRNIKQKEIRLALKRRQSLKEKLYHLNSEIYPEDPLEILSRVNDLDISIRDIQGKLDNLQLQIQDFVLESTKPYDKGRKFQIFFNLLMVCAVILLISKIQSIQSEDKLLFLSLGFLIIGIVYLFRDLLLPKIQHGSYSVRKENTEESNIINLRQQEGRLKLLLESKKNELKDILGEGVTLAMFREKIIQENKNFRINASETMNIHSELLLLEQTYPLNEAREYIDDFTRKGVDFNLNELIEERNSCLRRIEKIEDEQRRIREKLNAMEHDLSALYSTNETASFVQKSIHEIEEQIRILDATIQYMKKASVQIDHDFSSKFSNYVSKAVRFVTNGRYDKLMIDSKMNINIYHEGFGNSIPLERLSFGTIEQLNLIVRLEMAAYLIQDSLPVFLDEILSQVDNRRMENILIYLLEMSSNRQVLLFTCQQREKDYLDKYKKAYHLIQL